MVLVAATAFGLWSQTLAAAPVADSQRTPLDLRRTTLVVKDVDASLRLYRDALGMTVVYDHPIRMPRDAKDDAHADKASRLVLLRANDDFIGMLGLLQYTKPAREPRPAHALDGVLHPGDIVLLFNTRDLAATFARASATPDVTIETKPNPVTYPAYSGPGVIHVMFSSLYDPDGNYVELNQLLDDKLH
jgi:catechol 2,3-dioxygenase-like lactoylglutathione lyase family enzyme